MMKPSIDKVNYQDFLNYLKDMTEELKSFSEVSKSMAQETENSPATLLRAMDTQPSVRTFKNNDGDFLTK